MKKSLSPSNDYCPQTLFLYGTYTGEGKPNFGLFCWFSYCWDTEMGVMACIGEEKLTKERIKATKVFSANLVTEELLPLADYFGHTDGHNADKMSVEVEIEKGRVLDVPVLSKSPWIFELEVSQSIPLDDGEVFLCKIRNVLADDPLCDETLSVEQRIKSIRPIRTASETYFSWNGNAIGNWGGPMKAIAAKQ